MLTTLIVTCYRTIIYSCKCYSYQHRSLIVIAQECVQGTSNDAGAYVASRASTMPK